MSWFTSASQQVQGSLVLQDNVVGHVRAVCRLQLIPGWYTLSGQRSWLFYGNLYGLAGVEIFSLWLHLGQHLSLWLTYRAALTLQLPDPKGLRDFSVVEGLRKTDLV